MTEQLPYLVIIARTDAFSGFWAQLAEAAGLELRLLEGPEPVSGPRCAAVILACGGAESHAVDLLHEARKLGIDRPLVVGAATDHRLAVQLMQRGAHAYFALPDDARLLEEEVVGRARRASAARPRDGDSRDSGPYDFSELLGEAPALLDAIDRAAKVIPGAQATVLITGETGTGKELIARAIHRNGPRADAPFVAVNCSAIPGTLLESELFGHEKGAFTDARSAKPGLFEVADGGTLFLDEVAILPLELQSKLLRALETREVRRVGGIRDKQVDVRIIAAANVDLERAVEDGSFREDFYYRLAVVPIHLPPLRERGDDVLLLARHFLSDLAGDYGMSAPELTSATITELRRHRWPGNVRELRNAIERGLLLSGGGPLHPDHLALPLSGSRPAPTPGGEAEAALPFPATLGEVERAAARAMVAWCDGNKARAARRLGIARSRLYRLLESG